MARIRQHTCALTLIFILPVIEGSLLEKNSSAITPLLPTDSAQGNDLPTRAPGSSCENWEHHQPLAPRLPDEAAVQRSHEQRMAALNAARRVLSDTRRARDREIEMDFRVSVFIFHLLTNTLYVALVLKGICFFPSGLTIGQMAGFPTGVSRCGTCFA